MAIFASAGHNPKGKRIDVGAVNATTNEAAEMVKFRNKFVEALLRDHCDVDVIVDQDNETLSEYLKRIKTGNGSVVLEFHLDAASSPKATGTTCIVANDASELSKAFAQELVDTTAVTLGIFNRGVKPESYTYVGKLGIMRKAGIVALLELGFISNPEDMEKVGDECKITVLANKLAAIAAKYDRMIQ